MFRVIRRLSTVRLQSRQLQASYASHTPSFGASKRYTSTKTTSVGSTHAKRTNSKPVKQFRDVVYLPEDDFSITRAVDADQAILPLPDLPRAPPYPTPVLSQEELGRYLFPLYSRQWGVSTCEVTMKKEKGLAAARQLTALFSFNYATDAARFVDEIREMIKIEQHHPEDFLHDDLHVFLTVHTHVARMRKSVDGEGQQITSGITLRDVRFAILVERCFDEFVSTSRAYRRWHVLTSGQPREASHLRLIPKTDSTGRKILHPCQICAGEHWVDDCPSRFTVKPKWPCSICGGDHWRVLCPKAHDKPPKPCPACGSEGHWKRDCPTIRGPKTERKDSKLPPPPTLSVPPNPLTLNKIVRLRRYRKVEEAKDAHTMFRALKMLRDAGAQVNTHGTDNEKS